MEGQKRRQCFEWSRTTSSVTLCKGRSHQKARKAPESEHRNCSKTHFRVPRRLRTASPPTQQRRIYILLIQLRQFSLRALIRRKHFPDINSTVVVRLCGSRRKTRFSAVRVVVSVYMCLLLLKRRL